MRKLLLLIPAAFVAFIVWSALRSEPVRISDTRLIKDGAGVFLSGTFVNQTEGPIHSLEVKVEFMDAEHRPIATSMAKVEKLEAGDKARFKTAPVLASGVESFRVSTPTFKNIYEN